MKRSYEIDMCNGPLFGKIMSFAFPLMCSGVLQLLFNAADIVVVGRFTGSSALAAVGATSAINNLIINIFVGLSVGCSIITARYYGAQDWKNVSDTVHTAMLLSAVCGVFLIFVGIGVSEPVLSAMGTPKEDGVLDQAVLYMRIIFAGIPALMIYNFGSAILRAVGDTRRPLIFLFISGVLNVILNLIFVIVFHMGVAGVALATIISQCVSAVLVVLCLMHGPASYQLSLKELHISKDKLFEILKVGLPAGVQGAFFSISNIMIQSSINSFGGDAMAGNTAACNIEAFIYTVINSLFQASISFTSQNVGAKNKKRILPILYMCVGIVVVVGGILGIVAIVCGKPLLRIYTSEPAVIDYGLQRIKVVCALYFFCGLNEVACGMVRGLGYSLIPTVVTLAGVCGYRIAWIATVFQTHRTMSWLLVSYPISWILTFTVNLLFFFIFFRKWKKKLDLEAKEEALSAP